MKAKPKTQIEEAKILMELDKKAKLLIDEASTIRKRMKADETRLEEIKTELKKYELPKGVYVASKGGVLDLTYKKSFSPPTPIALYEWMKAKRMGKMFFSCITVSGKDTIATIGEEAYNSLRTENKSIPQMAFK